MAAAAPGAVITGATLLHQMSWLLFLAALLMGLLSADSITRERREGTLGLLLLTDLTPRGDRVGEDAFVRPHVVPGAARMPAGADVPGAGGRRDRQRSRADRDRLAQHALRQSWRRAYGCPAVFRERRYAVPATLGLVAALAFGPEVLGGSCFGLARCPSSACSAWRAG